LNDDTAFFRDRPATPERLATVIFDLLDKALPSGLLHRVRLSPTREQTIEVSR
jgi:6-pyruvoyl-tetrahydropterin synthase